MIDLSLIQFTDLVRTLKYRRQKVLTNGGFMTPPPLGVVTAKKLSNSGTSARWFCDTTSFKVVSSHRLLIQSLQKDMSVFGAS